MNHEPVLLTEAIAGLAIRANGIYIDGTFGRGGHTTAILETLSPKGCLLAIDKDSAAIAAAQRLASQDQRFCVVQGSFAEVARYVDERGWLGQVDGILLDLGVSSPQLEDPDRGFSFLREGPLDMRMNTTTGTTAAQWLEHASGEEIADVFHRYGEERYARRIAQAIVLARQTQRIATTTELAGIIKAAHPAWSEDKHPATRCFQAIRIFINHELDDLKSALAQSLHVLKSGGRLVVIGFHSLEDRVVKQFIQQHTKGDIYPRDFPVMQAQLKPLLRWVNKKITPGFEELSKNPRARSAVLRITEKL